MAVVYVNDWAASLAAALPAEADAGTTFDVSLPAPASVVGGRVYCRVGSEILIADVTSGTVWTIVERQAEDSDRYPKQAWPAGTAIDIVLTAESLSLLIGQGGGGGGAELAGSTWRFSTSLSVSNPGNGRLSFNNADQALATIASVSRTSEFGDDATNVLRSIRPGDAIYIQNADKPNCWMRFAIYDPAVDHGSWFELLIGEGTHQGGPPDTNDLLAVQLGRATLPDELAYVDRDNVFTGANTFTQSTQFLDGLNSQGPIDAGVNLIYGAHRGQGIFDSPLVVRLAGGTAGVDELQLVHNGSVATLRTGETGGFVVETVAADYLDVLFRDQLVDGGRTLRYESRIAEVYLSAPEFQIGEADNPTLTAAEGGVMVRRGQFFVGPSSSSFSVRINPATVGLTALTVKAAAGQTADLLRVDSSAGARLGGFDASGNVVYAGSFMWVNDGSGGTGCVDPASPSVYRSLRALTYNTTFQEFHLGPNDLQMRSAFVLEWTAGSTHVGTKDTGLERESAGVLKVTTGDGGGLGKIHCDGSLITNLSSVGMPAYYDYPEGTPSNPAADVLRVYSVDFNGVTFLEQRDSSGRTLRLGRDQISVGKVQEPGGVVRGQAVYIFGATGSTRTIKLALANARDTTPGVGLVLESGALNAFVRVMTAGVLPTFDTSAWTEGDRLFVSATTPGGLTTTPPVAPNYVQRVGFVLRQHATQGEIGVYPTEAVSEAGWVSTHASMHAGGGRDPITGPLALVAPTAATTPLSVKAAASQTADLIQCQNSAGTAVAGIDPNGQALYLTGAGVKSGVWELGGVIGFGTVPWTGSYRNIRAAAYEINNNGFLLAGTELTMMDSYALSWTNWSGYTYTKDAGLKRDTTTANCLRVTNGSTGLGSIKANQFIGDGSLLTGITGGGGGGTVGPKYARRSSLYLPFEVSGDSDEFDDTSFSGWTAVNNGVVVPTTTEKHDSLSVIHPGGGSSGQQCAYVKAHTFAANDYIECCFSGTGINQNYDTFGLVFADGNTYGAGSQVIWWISPSQGFISRGNWTNYLNDGGVTSYQCTYFAPAPLFLRLVYEGSNNWHGYVSSDGNDWVDITGTFARTLTPTHAGFSLSSWSGTGKHMWTVHYFYFGNLATPKTPLAIGS